MPLKKDPEKVPAKAKKRISTASKTKAETKLAKFAQPSQSEAAKPSSGKHHRKISHVGKTAAAPATSHHERIAELAYSHWLKRDQEHGSHEEDWLRAEQELLSRSSS